MIPTECSQAWCKQQDLVRDVTATKQGQRVTSLSPCNPNQWFNSLSKVGPKGYYITYPWASTVSLTLCLLNSAELQTHSHLGPGHPWTRSLETSNTHNWIHCLPTNLLHLIQVNGLAKHPVALVGNSKSDSLDLPLPHFPYPINCYISLILLFSEFPLVSVVILFLVLLFIWVFSLGSTVLGHRPNSLVLGWRELSPDQQSE